MDEETRKQIESLLGYILRTDARFIALQQAVLERLIPEAEDKKAFEAEVGLNFKFMYQKMLEEAEKLNPGLSARLAEGQNPYLGAV